MGRRGHTCEGMGLTLNSALLHLRGDTDFRIFLLGYDKTVSFFCSWTEEARTRELMIGSNIVLIKILGSILCSFCIQ